MPKLRPVTNVRPEPERNRLLLEELQIELQRLESRINHRLESVLESRPEQVKRHLSYASTLLEISLSPNPELNLFDVVAFLETSRHFLEKRDPQQTELVAVFDASIPEAWEIAKLVLDPEQQKDLAQVIDNWIDSHPGDELTEDRLRFATCPESMKEDLASDDSRGVRRLIQHANQAFQLADSTRLLAERGLHYAQRAPSLMRLHARVATHELIAEGRRALKGFLPARFRR